MDKRQAKIAQLEKLSTAEDFWNDNQAAQETLKEISAHKKWVEAYNSIASEFADLAELIELTEDDDGSEAQELRNNADSIVSRLEKLEFEALLSGPDDHRDAILTIHPGAGGTESQDWADMLFRMYNRWVERKGFTTELIDYQPGEEAGLKSAAMEVKGDFVYGFLKAESGVHRLVRISPFDASSRRHTSFVSVHVLPMITSNVDIEIRDEDVRIDTYRASGAGGQHVNKTSSAVRLTHEPTGIVVTCQSERSQHKNRDAAFRVLRARLYELQREEEAKKMQKYEAGKKKIEWGSQIRSYVFHPYNMVKDHRTDAETGNLQAVLDGDIDQFIEAYLADPDLNDSLGLSSSNNGNDE
ncbi:peptide chain release factor 2 [candidate division GN15 bacterium]|nr:peptide chain release factor 2 [candidate division GN15 bacterium]